MCCFFVFGLKTWGLWGTKPNVRSAKEQSRSLTNIEFLAVFSEERKGLKTSQIRNSSSNIVSNSCMASVSRL